MSKDLEDQMDLSDVSDELIFSHQMISLIESKSFHLEQENNRKKKSTGRLVWMRIFSLET
jgi:hypothetical protein